MHSAEVQKNIQTVNISESAAHISIIFYLQPFDHGNDLHQGKLLFTGVVVTCGSLILLRRAWTVLITEFIRGMYQFP